MSLKEYMQENRGRIDALLESHINNLPDSVEPKLKAAMRHGLLLGGKRVRPFLVFVTGKLLGADEAVLEGPAAAIECIHAYSLIHDDLPAMDNDVLRRGQPTVHKAFGEALGILAGDALQTLGFEILASHPMPEKLLPNKIRMLQELGEASGYRGMCGGQALDLEAEGHKVDLEGLLKVHRHKTGALIRCAVRMGALASENLDGAAMKALTEYSEAIGLAFQIHDDILDVTSSTEILGKTAHSDENLEKSTFPALLGLEGAKDYERKVYEKAVSALAPLKGDTSLLREFAEYIVTRGY
ncbi:MAG: (2E,6E)-farnesyl diphosphate synthase [Succinivibrionaceae bacterium]|nr:(2E,6E)-farnesyl diphosphate synthase [Succinivibrionaceae bacterium]